MVYPLTTKTIVKQVKVRQDKVFRYTAVIRDQALYLLQALRFKIYINFNGY